MNKNWTYTDFNHRDVYKIVDGVEVYDNINSGTLQAFVNGGGVVEFCAAELNYIAENQQTQA